jgi:glycosyltransferase involved in cell wall biosynthesis
MSLQISVIICTRNRSEQLRACLEHVRGLEPPRGGWELVIVDNGSGDTTQEVVRDFAASGVCRVVAVHEKARGLSRARNAGIARSTGNICAFTDDDCYVRPDYLVQLCRAFEDSGAGYVGGRVVLHDPRDAPITIKDVMTPEVITPRRFLPAGIIHGANMAVSREVFQEVGGFDPLLGPGTPLHAADDIDLLARACWSGWPGIYDPRPVVAHHHGRKPGLAVDRLRRGYDYGRGAYYLKRTLNAQSRVTYLREWYWSIRHAVVRRRPDHASNELAGAVRYVAARIFSRDRAPRF